MSIKKVYNVKKFLLSVGMDILRFVGALLLGCTLCASIFGAIWFIGLFGHYVLHLGNWVNGTNGTSDYIYGAAYVLIIGTILIVFTIKGILAVINYFKDKWEDSVDLYATHV